VKRVYIRKKEKERKEKKKNDDHIDGWSHFYFPISENNMNRPIYSSGKLLPLIDHFEGLLIINYLFITQGSIQILPCEVYALMA
jgi:hypothetical protein